MITGVGIDIVQINRMNQWMENPGLLERYFHPKEIEYSFSRGNGAAQSFAARFAAKEAFGKALGTGLADFNLKDIIILNNEKGKPEVQLQKTALNALEKTGAQNVHISLTHEKENAVAMIILERN